MAKLDRCRPDGGFGSAIRAGESRCLGNNHCAALVTGWCRTGEFCEFVNNFPERFLKVAGICETKEARRGNLLQHETEDQFYLGTRRAA